MKNNTLIKNAKIVNEGNIFEGDILIEDDVIKEIDNSISVKSADMTVIDAEGNYVLPGMIDDQVHFREPGLTHKANIETESKAAVGRWYYFFHRNAKYQPSNDYCRKTRRKVCYCCKVFICQLLVYVWRDQ